MKFLKIFYKREYRGIFEDFYEREDDDILKICTSDVHNSEISTRWSLLLDLQMSKIMRNCS